MMFELWHENWISQSAGPHRESTEEIKVAA